MSNINELLEGLRDGFLDDMPSRIDKIEDEVMSSIDNDSYDELFRMVHSLKGTAGSYDFHELTKVAHGMEDVMQLLMSKNKFGTSDTVDVLLKYIDILRDTTDSLLEKLIPLDLDERLGILRNQFFKENINILVVEPSEVYASMIEYSLSGLSINFTFKNDGFPALDSLLINKYDLLITSLECPRLNGNALVAALRLTHSFNRGIKVILITSKSFDKVINKDDFSKVLDRKMIKEGGLKEVVSSLT